MKRTGKNLLAIFLMLILAITVSGCEDQFDKGLKAYRAGDYATALVEWTPLAEVGHTDAQYNIGLMYAKGGRGLPKNEVVAAMWFAMAALEGDEGARRYRDRLLNGMTSEQLYEAGRLMRQCVLKQYKNCP